jgi:hypothetical protein
MFNCTEIQVKSPPASRIEQYYIGESHIGDFLCIHARLNGKQPSLEDATGYHRQKFCGEKLEIIR